MGPYVYTANNPMKYVDRDGQGIWMPKEQREFFAEHPVVAFFCDPSSAMPSPVAIEVFGAKLGGAAGTIAKFLANVRRGREIEAAILEPVGLTKNTKKFETMDPKTGKIGTTVPDAIDPETGDLIDIKDRMTISDEKQIRLQRQAVEDQGVGHVILTGSQTRITEPLQNSNTRILPREGLGPTGQQLER
jgi:hypothetical protein